MLITNLAEMGGGLYRLFGGSLPKRELRMVPLKKEKLRNLKSKNSSMEGGGSFWKLSRAKNRIFFEI